MARVKRPKVDACDWNEDSDGVWFTACGEAHQFTTDGPRENSHRFCPYCGLRLRAVAYTEPR